MSETAGYQQNQTSPRVALGHALAGRSRELVDALLAQLPATVETQAEHGVEATLAVAAWIAGDSREPARKAGSNMAARFGRDGARRDILMPEITKRILRWRDAMRSALEEEAERLSTPRHALDEALKMLTRSTDVTLVRTSQAFEEERQALYEEVLHHQALLTHQATHDPLTGLANRTLILDRVEQALARARRNGTEVVAIFIDLDHFKYINDTYGHRQGDQLLCAVVERLERAIRESDTLGRLGGDEFVVISEWAAPEIDIRTLATRLQRALEAPFEIPGPNTCGLTMTASFGFAVADGCDPDELLRRADMAMYGAKTAGRDRHMMFETDMELRSQPPAVPAVT